MNIQKLTIGFMAALLSLSATAVSPRPMKDFLALKGKDSAGEIKNVVVIYKNKKDAQPKCLGCVQLRLVLDVKNRNSPVGGTMVRAVQVVLFDANNKVSSVTRVEDLKSIYRNPWSAAEGTFLADISTLIPKRNFGKVEVQLLKQKCLNLANPSCVNLVVDQTLKINSVLDLFALNPQDQRPRQ